MAKRKRNSSNSSDDEGNDSKANKVSSDSSSSSDDDGDWNDTKKKTKSKAKAKTKAVKKNVKQVDEDLDEKEEGEVEDDDEDIEEFNDGYDENLMGDEDDQKRLALMTEKEREQELFNRSEKREVLKTRFEIEKKLRMAKKKELNKSQTDASQRSTERRRNMEDKRKVKDAIKDLKQIREKKKEKLKQQRLRAADVYSSDSDSDDDKNAGRKTSSSSSSSSSSSDDSDDEKPKVKNEDVKKEEEDWDETHGSDREDEVEAWNLTVDHLNDIRLSRHKMEKWCHSPFFKETVTGCFVRIGIGLNPTSKQNVYIVAQITDVTETPKIYNLGKTRTNKGIKLRHARNPERIYRLEFVSDSPFATQEYQKWVDNMEKDRCELPSKDFIERKKRDVQNALSYSYTESDIESIVQEKERFNNRPVNFAMKKTRLMKDKELAEMNGDNEKVEHILQEIDELEAEAKKLDKKRTQNIAAISYINERNRMRNIKEAEKALVEQSAEMKKTMKDDPFTRRKCTPTMIHMFNKNKVKTEVDSVTEDLTEKIEIYSKSQTEENGKEVSVSDQNSSVELSQKLTPVATERPLSPGHHNDLFSAHNFDIKIDFDVDIGIPTASSANNFSSSSFSSNNNSFIAPKPTNRRSLNLDEYKKKKGLI